MMRGKLILPLLAGALAMGACEDLGTGSTASGSARLSILLTDAPGDLRAAVVTITDVYLQPAEGENAERVYLRQGAAITTDLLTLQNKVQELVSEKPVPAGHYEQLRLVITGGYIEVEQAGGSSAIYASSPGYEGLPAGARVAGELQMPGFARSGLKVMLTGGTSEENDGAVTVAGEQTLLVDFDVSRSFARPAGNSGKWIMRPVLKATPVQSAASLTVSLSLGSGVQLPSLGSAAVALSAFQVTLTPAAGGDAKTAALTDANADGTFEASFPYLQPGEYRVGIAGPTGITFQTDQALPLTVTVGTGASATAAFKLSSVALVK
jgi:hypothetical protein